jgi:hypothetical protein
VARGAFRPPLLQRPFQTKVPTLGGFPGFLSQELMRRGDRRLDQTQVNPDDFCRRLHHGRRDRHHDMQPPGAVWLAEQVRGSDGASGISGRGVWHRERHRHPPSNGRDTDGLCGPGQGVGVPVIPWGACPRAGTGDQPARLLAGKGRCECLGRFYPRLNHQVGHQARAHRLRRVIRGVMQPHTIFFGVCPAKGTDVIKSIGKALQRGPQRLGLV